MPHTALALLQRAPMIPRRSLLALLLLAACGGDRDVTPTTPPSTLAFRHDHTPHHGGVVGMAGVTHFEALATTDGTVRVWVTDAWRRPVPPASITGAVSVGDRTAGLVPHDDALSARIDASSAPERRVRITVVRDGTPLALDFLLPVAPGARAAAGVPPDGCVPGGDGARCTLAFARPVTALAATAAGTTVYVGTVDLGVSRWRLPDGRLIAGFATPPAIDLPAGVAHADAIGFVALDPEGNGVLGTIENRLVLWDGDGRLRRELPAATGLIRDLVWTRGGMIAFTAFYDATLHVIRAVDGRPLHDIPLGGEGAAVAVDPDGHRLAVGTETGTIRIVDPATPAEPRMLAAGGRAVRALAFAGDRLLAAGDDGRIDVWDVGRGALLRSTAIGAPVLRLAVAPNGDAVAAIDGTGAVRLLDVEGARVRRLPLDVRTLAIAWAGDALLTGDMTGQLIVWPSALRLVQTEADGDGHATLDRRAIAARGNEAPPTAHRRHRRLVERRVTR